MDAMRAVLRHRDFRLLWLASSTSALGDRIVFVALALYVTDIGSPSDVGIVLAANAIPLVLFVLIGGVWADRLERHRVMIAADVVRAVLHGTLAALIFVGPVPIWAIAVIEAAFGTAEAFFNPAVTGLVPQTVPEGEVQQANAMRTSSLALHYLLADDLRHSPTPRVLPTLDATAETARAYAGLAEHRYLLVVDGVAMSDLDAPLSLTERSIVSFVRLLPLIGG